MHKCLNNIRNSAGFISLSHVGLHILSIINTTFERRPSPRRPQIVVWAPHTSALDVALPAFGLEEFRGEVICIVRSGTPLPGLRATFVQAGSAQAAEALAGAAAVLCADPYDPGPAVAFARRGFGIVASELSGAQEYIDGAVSVDPASARGLQIAAAVAVGRPASLRRELAPPLRAPVIAPGPIPASELPLVSIVTATYNRHADLRRMLTCLRDQTYPRIESIGVVNDCGQPIEDVVAEFPFARVLNQEVNAGPIRAGIRGTREAKGSFIGYLPDDDWLYPDHVERLVNAMAALGCVGSELTRQHADPLSAAGIRQRVGSTTAFAGGIQRRPPTPSGSAVLDPDRRSIFDVPARSLRRDRRLAAGQRSLRSRISMPGDAALPLRPRRQHDRRVALARQRAHISSASEVLEHHEIRPGRAAAHLQRLASGPGSPEDQGASCEATDRKRRRNDAANWSWPQTLNYC